MPSVLVISDRVEHADQVIIGRGACPAPWVSGEDAARHAEVAGSYLERLPLACIAGGLAQRAEIWHHVLEGGGSLHRGSSYLQYRGVAVDGGDMPMRSQAMLRLIRDHGAPHILVVYGLGVDAELLDACENSVRIYNSIDAPSLRVPEAVSGRMDIILTGAQWQSDEVEARHPGMATAILPVGPEFTGVEQFRPIPADKDYDLVYVAAAQAYKKHDLLFDALQQCPRDVRALCIFGYGELADELRAGAADRGLSVDFIGPPGVPINEVNRLMNRAKFGVVCGRDDGAPAILTEYMLAGLPVLANAELVCGLQYIRPETGRIARPEDFAAAIMAMREDAAGFSPRQTVLDHWAWPHSIGRLAPLIAAARRKKAGSNLHQYNKLSGAGEIVRPGGFIAVGHEQG